LRLCIIANIAALNGATAGATVKGSGVAVVAFLAGSFDVVATRFDASSLSADHVGADPSVLLCAGAAAAITLERTHNSPDCVKDWVIDSSIRFEQNL